MSLPIDPHNPAAQADAVAPPSPRHQNVQHKDEIELLISAAVFFGLLQLPGAIVESWEAWSLHQEQFTGQIGYALLRFGYGIVFVLIASFFLHLVLRGLWIGLIGLESVFPSGVDWNRLARSAPITTEYQRSQQISLGATIAWLDRIASLVFVSASLIVLMSIIGLVTVGLAFALELAGLGLLVRILFGFFLAAVLLQALLDSVIAARSPRLAAKSWLRKTVRLLNRAFQMFLPRVVLTPLLTLQSRMSQLTMMVAVMLVLTLVMAAFPLHVFARTLLDRSDLYAYVDAAVAAQGTRLESFGPDDDVRDATPRLDQSIVASGAVRLFLPMSPKRNAPDFKRACAPFASGDAPEILAPAEAQTLRDCMARLWRVELDGTELAPAQFQLARQGSQRGLIAVLPARSLAPGTHRIVVTTKNLAASPDRTRKPTPPQSLLFWRV